MIKKKPKRCKAVCKNGKRCLMVASLGEYCTSHWKIKKIKKEKKIKWKKN